MKGISTMPLEFTEVNATFRLCPIGGAHDRRHIERDLRIRLAMLSAGADVSVLMADLDHFKSVNDCFGHTKGDEVLRQYFSVLRELVSNAGGEAYRCGGDETLAILPGIGERKAKEIAEAVRSRTRVDLEMCGKDLPRSPTVSIGLLTLRHPITVPRAILDRVDRLLYRAKAEGRDLVVAETAL